MRFTLRVWRQKDARDPGRFETYEVVDVVPDMSFLEVLDKVNEDLIRRGQDAIAFDSDCREGICGTCCIMVDGRAHGRLHGTTVCELRMRAFRDGDTITAEPFRARPFPVVKDLMIDRSIFDTIIQAGGYVSIGTGAASDANAIPVTKEAAERAMDSAQCIGCGACVASCPNAAAMLFTSAKLAHLSTLPQGRVEWRYRVLEMVEAMNSAGFGNCSNHGECEAACPKQIKLTDIAQMNRQFLFSSAFTKREKAETS
ncbi:MAG: succinate dehydrogenase/fumarate reductase iron-sulfur subunit [Planctomycetota bacterium]|nr:succinate dehydrogenase/fumarate reductase iron-sulfur subunit [Planctomycetota bacterium]